jgi:hypothetical protein
MPNGFQDAAVSLARSSWIELGVSGWDQRAFPIAIDLEPLMALTATIGGADPRLVEQANLWTATYPELVSRARLKRQIEALGSGKVSGLRDLPADGRRKDLGGESRPGLRLEAPACLQMRLRSAFGVGARAELLRIMLVGEPGVRFAASDLAPLAGYSKRNVEMALRGLERASLVSKARNVSAFAWWIAGREELELLLGPIPRSSVSFASLVAVMIALLSLDDVADEPDHVRSAEARRAVEALRAFGAAGGIDLPSPRLGSNAWSVILDWAQELPASATQGEESKQNSETNRG